MILPAAHLPVVQKYGGTSVGNPAKIKKIAQRVAFLSHEGLRKIAIVVSAMSGETDRLIALIKDINPKAADRHYDMAVAAGEQVSVALMAAALQTYGLKSKGFLAYQLGIMTCSAHSKARISSIDPSKLHECWQKGEIPVIAGFQGINSERDITTLGRGGSDTSAVALAVALNASYCEINTDVDGVYSSDPRVVSRAKLQKKLDFEVAMEMASLGSKVLHSRCVELGAKYSMPIVVRNAFDSNPKNGTIIMKLNETQRLEAPVVSGVTIDTNIAKVNLRGLLPGSETISHVFELIALAGINVDIIVHDEFSIQDTMTMGFTMEKQDLTSIASHFEQWKQLPGFSKMDVTLDEDLAKVSVVGLGMQSHPGVASKTFSVLTKLGIEIKMISTSEIKISCVIHEKASTEAARSLHAAFLD